PRGELGPDSLTFTPSSGGIADTNWIETAAFRAALNWAPTENLTIAPALMYEKRRRGDTNSYWAATSDRSDTDFSQPLFSATVDEAHVELPGAPKEIGGEDEFILPSLTADWELDNLDLIATTAYFSRDQASTADYTALYTRLFAGRQVPEPGDFAYAKYGNSQDVFTQEVRLQTNDPDARLRWVAGLFYSNNKQFSIQWNRPNFVARLPTLLGATTDGPPFGPGYSAFVNYYGDTQWEDGTTWHARLLTRTEQLAGFGQVDFKLTDRLTLTAGLRVSQTEIEFTSSYGGPSNNLNQPHRRACVPPTGAPGGAPCIPVEVGEFALGEGPFAIAHPGGHATATDTPVTPKIGLSYQRDDSNLFYANIAKGYRNGGAQARVASTCREELISLGFIDGTSPEQYDPDSVWSYEIGAKNQLFDGRLQLDTSVYHIVWSDIQTNVSLTSCGLGFVTNGGGATSTGVDFQLTARIADPLTVRLSVGYKDTELTAPVVFGGRTLLSDGSTIPGSGPPLTIVTNAEYAFIAPGGFDAYVRADYMYNSRLGRSGTTDPKTVSYDPLDPVTDENHLVNVRVGAYFSNLEVALFANNLLNALPHLALDRTRNTPIYTDYSFRPRTIGLQVAYRY
ncbi:MAG TPA: TonB-dependent receptor, partial [Steroidobacteraceae bacterium]